MDPFMSVILVLSGLFVGWTIGANDAGNCMGPCVGAGILNFQGAAFFVGVFAFFGAIMQGGPTMDTMGNSLFVLEGVADVHITIALFAAALVITVLTIFSIPISTTQAVIGAVIGLGLMLPIHVNYVQIKRILLYGLLTPFAACIVAYLFHRFVVPRLFTRQTTFLTQERKVQWLVLLSGIFLAYSLGANNIGNAMGFTVSKGILVPVLAGILGGLSLAFGAATLGKRVMYTVGMKITALDGTMALSAQVGAALVVYILTLMAIPTSFTFAIVGAIGGVGLVKGLNAVRSSTIITVILAWFVTPAIATVLTITLFSLYNLL